MRMLCDVCEAAAGHVFCAADEAALCWQCDEKVHGCNKLASRHLRLRLAETKALKKCDICENAHAFFFCGIDGTSLCLQCDTDVHVGAKRTHERYLLMAQRVEASKFLPLQRDGNKKEEVAGFKHSGFPKDEAGMPYKLHCQFGHQRNDLKANIRCNAECNNDRLTGNEQPSSDVLNA